MTAPVAIEVRDLHKGFRVPERSPAGLPRKALHPFRARGYNRLPVLSGISFEVRRGEFFGVVGRNGCGKSTLLKLLASIYRADQGTVRIAGSVAPFIELGVGFRNELPAYENVVINGVMMGLTPREARSRYEAIMQFADLEDHGDLRLKNYSSGMRVRLAFSIMTNIESDILLIDEVLAVGDADFAAKCEAVFEEMIERGRTVLLVTHAMGAVRRFCHRAMLINDGGADTIGAPDEVAARYNEINFERREVRPGRRDQSAVSGADTTRALIPDLWLEGPAGRTSTVAERAEIELHAEVRQEAPIDDPCFGFAVVKERGGTVFAPPPATLEGIADQRSHGTGYEVTLRLENPLAPGRYAITCGIFERRESRTLPVSPAVTCEFTVDGPSGRRGGSLSLRYELDAQQTGPVTTGAP